MGTRTFDELLASAFTRLQCRCNACNRPLEDFVQHIGGSFFRRQSLQHQREGCRDRCGKIAVDAVRLDRLDGLDLFGERQAHVIDARVPCCAQQVEAAVITDSREPANRRSNGNAICGSPLQKAVLNRVLGVCPRTEQAAGHRRESGTRRFEQIEVVGAHPVTHSAFRPGFVIGNGVIGN